MSWSLRYVLPEGTVNKLQANSIDRLIQTAKHAHYVNVVVRINGEDKVFEADWLKHLERDDG